jgi:biopolymer transport protein ExbD
MRRFSQRSALVTLSEINITPLLDLAFVLLIIFVITTPLLEGGINLKLPQSSAESQAPEKKDIRTVEIDAKGNFYFDKHRMQLNQIETQLVNDFKANPNLIVFIRADEEGRNKETYAIIDRCLKHGITRFSLRTDPTKRP